MHLRDEGRISKAIIRQTKLSTLQVSFHQSNICWQNNRKRKGKVYKQLVRRTKFEERGGNIDCEAGCTKYVCPEKEQESKTLINTRTAPLQVPL